MFGKPKNTGRLNAESSAEKSKKPAVERRKYSRVGRNLILTYGLKENGDNQIFQSTQMRDISAGGMCFVTTEAFDPLSVLWIKLKTPYLVQDAPLEGTVIESKEKVKNLIYHTRVKFMDLPQESEVFLKEMIQYFLSEEKS